MSFDKLYHKRKDHRKQYYKSKAIDRSCRPGGSCKWCLGSRLHNRKKREMFTKKDIEEEERLG